MCLMNLQEIPGLEWTGFWKLIYLCDPFFQETFLEISVSWDT